MAKGMFSKALKVSVIAGGVAFSVMAATLSDAQRDQQAQKVISLYGPDDTQLGGAKYNDGILNIPDEQVCLLRQLWVPQLLNAGNTKYESNEKKCIGFEDGQDVVSGIVNLTADTVTGDTLGKVWGYDSATGLSYANVRITSSPTASEPFGRFQIDLAIENQTAVNVAIFEIKALGSQFKVRGKFANGLSFTGFVDGQSRKGIYRLPGQTLQAPVRLGYDSNHVCFKRGTNLEECFPRALSQSATTSNVKVNSYNYGIYKADGSRYTGTLYPLAIDGSTYTLASFGGALTPNPGGLTTYGSDTAFWTDKAVTMNGQPYTIQWLTKIHSVQPAAAVRLTSLTGTQITLDADLNDLGDPATLTDSAAKSIGVFPLDDWTRLQTRVKDGLLQ